MTRFANEAAGRRLSLLNNMAVVAEASARTPAEADDNALTDLERSMYESMAKDANEARARFDQYLVKFLAAGGQHAEDNDPYKLRSELIKLSGPLDEALDRAGLAHSTNPEVTEDRHAFYKALLERNERGHRLYKPDLADQFGALNQSIIEYDRTNTPLFERLRDMAPDNLAEAYFKPMAEGQPMPLDVYGPRYFSSPELDLEQLEIIDDLETLIKESADPLSRLDAARTAERGDDTSSEASLDDWIDRTYAGSEPSSVLPFKSKELDRHVARTRDGATAASDDVVRASLDDWIANKTDVTDTAQSKFAGTKRTVEDAKLDEQARDRCRMRGDFTFKL